MDLNKDNRDVYTIDSESYSMYMKENRKKPRDLLSTIIQFLIVILLFILVYLFFNILKNDLTFSEVFNKKELLSTYESLMDSDEKTSVNTENYREVLAKKIATVSEAKPTEHHTIVVAEEKLVTKSVEKKEVPKIALIVSKVATKKIEPIAKVASEPIVQEHEAEEVVSAEKVVAIEKVLVVEEEPKPLKSIETVEVKEIVEAEPSDVIETAEVPKEEGELTESYLDRMVAELNEM